jgi:2-methylisocitrate lyase-like PEP mutase family enzyme
MNVRRTVESFAIAGAAGVMIKDQTWPKSNFPRPRAVTYEEQNTLTECPPS